jgi:hypothetical protein
VTVDLPPLTVAEARAILAADEALGFVVDITFGIEERDAWERLVESARGRIAAFEGERGTAQ